MLRHRGLGEPDELASQIGAVEMADLALKNASSDDVTALAEQIKAVRIPRSRPWRAGSLIGPDQVELLR